MISGTLRLQIMLSIRLGIIEYIGGGILMTYIIIGAWMVICTLWSGNPYRSQAFNRRRKDDGVAG